jgi:uncharacterized protein (DUF1501 family)
MTNIRPTQGHVDSALDSILGSLDRAGAVALSRRRLLQIGGGVAAGSILASRLPVVRDMVGLGTADAQQITPTVVLVYLDGGNDGLNTLVPHASGRYRDLRGAVAIPEGTTLPISSVYGLHPSLPFVKAWWDQGKVAFVRGVGYSDSNLSHFTSIDHWHAGQGGVNSPVIASPHSGWVGRYGDLHANNPFATVAIGPQTPLSMRGLSSSALQIPIPAAVLFGNNPGDGNETFVANAMRSLATTGTGTGLLGSGIANRTVSALNVAPSVASCWNGVDGTSINRQLGMAANLINARLGVRVVTVTIDGFDTHAQQLSTHANLLSQVNSALAMFFARLDPALSRYVTVMTYSEFGRRAKSNDSAGTDHGTSSVGMVFGANVAGGIYGEDPGLNSLDSNGNPLVSTDFRRMYATVLEGWLGTDSTAVLGAQHAPLPLFAAPPGSTPASTTTSTSSTSSSTTSTTTLTSTTLTTTTLASTTTTTTPTTTPGSTQVVTRPTVPQAPGPGGSGGRPTVPQVARATDSIRSLMDVSVSGRTIEVSVDRGPLRNDTYVMLRRPDGSPVLKRYLNNQSRAGIVTRTSGRMTFPVAASGRYLVELFTNGTSQPLQSFSVTV